MASAVSPHVMVRLAISENSNCLRLPILGPEGRHNRARPFQKQMEHHQAQSFEDEYLALLAKHEVEYDKQYVFD